MKLHALPAGPLLIGVSGGRDSVALLHALATAGGRELVVCHLDHGLRTESAEDAAFVETLARTLRVECVIAREDVRARAKRTRRSLETAAREARYEFFARIATERAVPRLVLAHHADDQVETFLFNLLRGTGSGGLAGMRPISLRGKLEIHRPLLGVWREEIDAYIAEHRLAFREDASNTDPRHTRNRLRHEVVPMLCAAFGQDVRRAIWRAAELCAAEHEFLTGLLVPSDTAAALDVSALRALPLAVQRRVLHAWLRANGVRDVGFDDVENVRALLDGPRAKTNLAGARHARRRAGRLFLDPSQPMGRGGADVSDCPA
jgi:tRNA(Ile)-lysidine synthase